MRKEKIFRLNIVFASKVDDSVIEKKMDVSPTVTFGEIYSLTRAELGACAIKTSKPHSINKITLEVIE